MKINHIDLKPQPDEEISEKRTSVLGYVLLTLMVIFIITAGNTVFYDLSRIPDEPVPLSECVSRLDRQYTDYFIETCKEHPNFTQTDSQFGLDSLYQQLFPLVVSNQHLSDELESALRKETELKETRMFLYQKYGVSLQEESQSVSTSSNRILSSKRNAKQLLEIEARLSNHQTTLDSIKLEQTRLDIQLKPILEQFKTQLAEANNFLKWEAIWKKWYEFLLKLLFIMPLLGSSIVFYNKLKAKNSPYTIIVTALVSAFSILFLQISSVLLYHVVPHKWLGQLLEWLIAIPFFSYVIYYAMVLAIILFFGGMVFYIQKRVFNPSVVARRRLREHKCPSCSFPIEAGQKFCTDCGTQIRVECELCGSLRYPDLPYCSTCGNKK